MSEQATSSDFDTLKRISDRPITIIESPYGNGNPVYKKYLLLCLEYATEIGLAPFASHALYTQFLDDTDLDKRTLGIGMGFAFLRVAKKSLVFNDFGVSKGMEQGIRMAENFGIFVQYVRLHCSGYPDYAANVRELMLEHDRA